MISVPIRTYPYLSVFCNGFLSVVRVRVSVVPLRPSQAASTRVTHQRRLTETYKRLTHDFCPHTLVASGSPASAHWRVWVVGLNGENGGNGGNGDVGGNINGLWREKLVCTRSFAGTILVCKQPFAGTLKWSRSVSACTRLLRAGRPGARRGRGREFPSREGGSETSKKYLRSRVPPSSKVASEADA